MSNTQASRGAAPAPEAVTGRNRMIASIGALLALALASLDVSVVSAAMPRIAEDLGGLRLYAWVGISYAVASAVIVPIAGKLGDMFGRKPFLLVGIVGFLVFSFLCGASQDMLQLVIFRGAQGLFAGCLMANIFTLVADVFPAEKRTQMQGIFFSVAGLSMVIGPPFGGFLTDTLNWRWVFYVNIPIGLLALLCIAVAVPLVRASANWRDIDFLGVVTLVAGLVPVLIALSLTGDGHAWGSPEVLVPLVGGVLLLVVFVLVETRSAANPIVPFGLFRNNQFTVMAIVAFFSAFAMMGTVFYVPLLYQGVLGVSATYSGSLVIPLTLALMVVPPIAGKALTAVPRYRYLGTLAFALMVGGLLLLATIDADSGRLLPILAMVLIGVGIGISFPMATSVVQSAVPMSQIGVGTSQVQFWRMIAGPVSLAILGFILSSQLGGAGQGDVAATTGSSPELLAAALHDLFFAAAWIVAIGLVATLFLKEVPLRDMAAMMKARAAGGSGAKQQPAQQQPTQQQPAGSRS